MALEKGQSSAMAASGQKKDEPVIHVIPAQFHGAALKKQVEPVAQPPKSAPVVPPAMPSASPRPAAPSGAMPPKPPASEPKPQGKKKKFPLIPVIILVVVLLLGGGVIAYLSFNKAPTQLANTNVNATPSAQCGDAKCDASENPATCPSDCQPPGPVCGDGLCQDPESYAFCVADCPAPVAACGDAKCDVGEDTTSCPADCTVTPTPTIPASGADSDSDGLTDVEERDVYGSNPLLSNTDGDSFVDLNEVLNLFDPAKSAPASLKDNPGIATYADTESFPRQITVLYPRSWLTTHASSDEPADVFTAPTGEKIILAMVPNPDNKTLMELYLANNPSVNASDVQQVTTKSGYSAVLGPDRMSAYLFGPEGIVYAFEYSLNGATALQYKVTFEMMVNAFVAATPAEE